MIRHLEFCRRDVADRLEDPAVVEPVDPFQRCVFNGLEIPPWTAAVNDFSLVETDDGFGQRVVVGIAHAAYRGLRTRLGEALGIADRQILGEFNPSSQQLLIGGCDGHKEAGVRAG